MSPRRGFGLILLLVLVVAPLSVFALSALLEDDPSDSLVLSVDGLTWTPRLDHNILASGGAWEPGQERSAVVYVHNRGSASVAADLIVTSTASDPLVGEGFLTVTTQVGSGPVLTAGQGATGASIELRTVLAQSTVPVLVSATFSPTAPANATMDAEDMTFRFRFVGVRLDDNLVHGPLDAGEARLWLAPVFVVLAASAALLVQRRRQAVRSTSRGDASDTGR